MEQNNSNKLLAALDAVYGFPNQTGSTFKKLKQIYDDKKKQHVIWIAYFVTVKPGQQQTESTVKSEPTTKVKPKYSALYRELTGA